MKKDIVQNKIVCYIGDTYFCDRAHRNICLLDFAQRSAQFVRFIFCSILGSIVCRLHGKDMKLNEK